MAMRAAFTAFALLVLTSCVTNAPSASAWTQIEGCWREPSDHWPAHMSWRGDPEHAGGYLGEWRREAAQGDVETMRFTLRPAGEQMRLCMRTSGAAEECTPAVFGRAGWRRDGVAVFDVQGRYHEFGYAGAVVPFFGGNARDCG